jgi:hypothetical protein
LAITVEPVVEEAVDHIFQSVRVIERQRSENPGQDPSRGDDKDGFPDKYGFDFILAKYKQSETDYQCNPHGNQKGGYDLGIVIYEGPHQRGGHGESDNDEKDTGQPRYGFPVHNFIV